MPGSRWDGKKWPVLYYADLLQKLELFPVILGTQQDLASTQLCNELLARGLPFYSGVGKWDLVATAQILSQAPSGYLGGDTGLAHLAEAVGVSAQVIFGPTTPEMGFGPWRSGSRALGLDLGCRPCGKDGRFCYRLIARHQCLGGLRPDEVFRQLKEGRE
jgi:heptosyltransferase-2